MPPTAYVETSVIGYLTMRPSRDLVIAAAQAITRDWWETRRAAFDLVSSDVVREEITVGNAAAANERLKVLGGFRLLDVTEEAGILAERLLTDGPLPPKAQYDALHISGLRDPWCRLSLDMELQTPRQCGHASGH